MIKKLTAIRPHQIFPSGRTSPLLVEAMDDDCNRYEVVVKIFTESEGGSRARIAELFCNLLANELGMNTPAPYLLKFPDGFEQLVQDAVVSDKIKNARGYQYACHYYSGLSIVPPGLPIPSDFEIQAASIMTYDGLIQNPDRRPEKPNLLKGDDGYHVIDHDQALGMFDGMIIGGSLPPWAQQAAISPAYSFLKTHLFSRVLKGKDIAFKEIEEAIRTMDDSAINILLDQIPTEWWQGFDKYDEMKEYFLESKNYSQQITDLVKGSISA